MRLKKNVTCFNLVSQQPLLTDPTTAQQCPCMASKQSKIENSVLVWSQNSPELVHFSTVWITTGQQQMHGARQSVFYYNWSDSLEHFCLISVYFFQICYPLECGAKLWKAKELTGSLQVCFVVYVFQTLYICCGWLYPPNNNVAKCSFNVSHLVFGTREEFWVIQLKLTSAFKKVPWLPLGSGTAVLHSFPC